MAVATLKMWKNIKFLNIAPAHIIADFLVPQFGMMKSYLLLDSILGTTFMFFLQVKNVQD